MKKETKNNIVNLILFQTGWMACVAGAVYIDPLTGVVYGVAFLVFHLINHHQRSNEISFIVFVALIGYLIDSQLVNYGFFEYYEHEDWLVAPLWIASLWAIFSTTIGRSLSWLSSHYVLAALLGAVFGPVAYYSAAEIGAVTILKNNQGLYFQSFIWACMMPLMFWLYQFLNQQDPSLQKGETI